MTKTDLARIVCGTQGKMTNREALRAIDCLFDALKNRLMQGESIHIVGFGTLEVVFRKSRQGRNPITGDPIEVAGHRALVFRPSRAIRSV
jgi:DNA-binding protein HU-beta